MAKHYIESHDPPPANAIKGISVYHGCKEHILYLNLVLSQGLELHLIQNERPLIELSYAAEDKVVFSMRDNLIHFIVISSKELNPKIKATEITNWLEADFDLGHGHAMALYAYFKGKRD
jgi:hypothetical protein